MAKRHNNRKPRNNEVIDFKPAQKRNNVIKYKRKIEVNLIPRNVAQEQYVEDLLDFNVRFTFAVGPAGTGKTLLSVLRAIQALKNNEVKRIVITRPAVSVDEQHGFLPGDLNEKMAPWIRPIQDILEEFWSPEEIKDMLEDRVLEIAPLAYMRGRTFKNCYIIADEMQNSTCEQMKMLLTRPGTGTYLSVTGDAEQHDRGFEQNGLLDFLNRYNGTTSIGITEFGKGDVERDPIVKDVLDMYGE